MRRIQVLSWAAPLTSSVCVLSVKRRTRRVGRTSRAIGGRAGREITALAIRIVLRAGRDFPGVSWGCGWRVPSPFLPRWSPSRCRPTLPVRGLAWELTEANLERELGLYPVEGVETRNFAGFDQARESECAVGK